MASCWPLSLSSLGSHQTSREVVFPCSSISSHPPPNSHPGLLLPPWAPQSSASGLVLERVTHGSLPNAVGIGNLILFDHITCPKSNPSSSSPFTWLMAPPQAPLLGKSSHYHAVHLPLPRVSGASTLPTGPLNPQHTHSFSPTLQDVLSYYLSSFSPASHTFPHIQWNSLPKI